MGLLADITSSGPGQQVLLQDIQLRKGSSEKNIIKMKVEEF
jgi:hypothetical protein